MNNKPMMEDPFSLKGKVAMITGAPRGIGAAITRRFVAAGAHVGVTHRGTQQNAAAIEETLVDLGGERFMAVVSEASSASETKKAAEAISDRFGTIDILILNAAATNKQPWDQIEVDEWDRIMEVNLRGAFVGCLAVIKGMRRQQYGKIITLGSVMATTGDPRALHYVSSKGGLLAFARSLSRSEGSNGIRVNCIIPGAILVEKEAEAGIDPAKTLAWMQTVQALDYRGQPVDIAYAAQYLSSPASDFVTGQALTVDGGWTNG